MCEKIMKLKKFAVIDITILTLIALISEYFGSKIFKSGQDFFYISLAQVFLLLIVVRWRWWSMIPIFILSIARVFIYKAGNLSEFLIYFLPMFSLSLANIVRIRGMLKNINKNRVTALLYYSSFYLLFFLITGVLTIILISSEYSFINDIFKYMLSYILGLIIMFAFTGQRTMLVDMIGNYQKNKEGK